MKTGILEAESRVKTNVVDEFGTGSGVVVDGLPIKDGGIDLAGSADGDLYVRSQGKLARIPKGSPGDSFIMDEQGEKPTWGLPTKSGHTIKEGLIALPDRHNLAFSDVDFDLEDNEVGDETKVAMAKTNYYGTFSSGDLSSGVLAVSHNLNQLVVDVTVSDSNNHRIIPDEITYIDVDTVHIDLSSHGSISGKVMIIKSGGSGQSDNTKIENVDVNDDSRTLQITDAGKCIYMNSEYYVGKRVFIPDDSTVNFPINTTIMVCQENVKTIYINASTGVTLNGISSGETYISERYGYATLIKRGPNSWYINGSIGAITQ